MNSGGNGSRNGWVSRMIDQGKELSSLRKRMAQQDKTISQLLQANQVLTATNQRLVNALVADEDLEGDDMAIKPRYLDD